MRLPTRSVWKMRLDGRATVNDGHVVTQCMNVCTHAARPNDPYQDLLIQKKVSLRIETVACQAGVLLAKTTRPLLESWDAGCCRCRSMVGSRDLDITADAALRTTGGLFPLVVGSWSIGSDALVSD